jgi:methyl coenzyme M reductase beta subunit
MNTLALGFTFLTHASDRVTISHDARVVTVLRGQAAVDFIGKVKRVDAHTAQLLMAKVTGNYRRGNERTARAHPRNDSGRAKR